MVRFLTRNTGQLSALQFEDSRGSSNFNRHIHMLDVQSNDTTGKAYKRKNNLTAKKLCKFFNKQYAHHSQINLYKRYKKVCKHVCALEAQCVVQGGGRADCSGENH